MNCQARKSVSDLCMQHWDFQQKQLYSPPERHGNLVKFPGLMPKNILMHFLELEELQKGHMKQTKQSTMVADEHEMLEFTPSLGVKHKDLTL